MKPLYRIGDHIEFTDSNGIGRKGIVKSVGKYLLVYVNYNEQARTAEGFLVDPAKVPRKTRLTPNQQ